MFMVGLMAVFQILTSHEKIVMVGLRIFEYTSRRTKFQNQPISGFREKHFCSGTGEILEALCDVYPKILLNTASRPK